MNHGGHCHHRVGIPDDALADTAHRHGDGVVGRALQRDDLGPRRAHVVLDFPQLFLAAVVVLVADYRAVGVHFHARDGRQGPGDHGGVAMLAEHIGVHVL